MAILGARFRLSRPAGRRCYVEQNFMTMNYHHHFSLFLIFFRLMEVEYGCLCDTMGGLVSYRG